MDLRAFRSDVVSMSKWLISLVLVLLFLGFYVYSRLSDRYVTTAVITSRASESRGFDMSSIAGLATLAGAGQRPAFEQLSYLVLSEPVLRQLLPELRRSDPLIVDTMLRRSDMETMRLSLEQRARSLFGKSAVVEDSDDRLIDAIRVRLSASKTPEGYYRLTFTSGRPAAQVKIVTGLLAYADNLIRAREKRDYQLRVTTYRTLLDQQSSPTERTILASLISREYSSYVSQQVGNTFSYVYVEPPFKPKRIYAPSLLLISILCVIMALALYLGLIALLQWIRRR